MLRKQTAECSYGRASANLLRAARAPLAASLVLVVGMPSAARADAEPHAQVGLDYDRAVGSESCPTTDALRADVASRLGYDPFVRKAGLDTIAVRIKPTSKGLEGTVTRLDAAHQPKGRPSTIASTSADCTELASALAVGISIAIDPLSITRMPEPAAPPEVPKPPPPAVANLVVPRSAGPGEVAVHQPDEANHPEAPLSTYHVYLGAGPSLAAFALPAVSFGARVFVGLAKGAFELDLEGRFDAPSTLSTKTGSIDASLVLGTIAPCFRESVVLVCAQLSVGALRGTGLGFDHSREENTVYVAGGARGGVELMAGKQLGFRVMLEAQVPFRPTRLEADGAVVWTTPPLSVSLLPTLVGRFP